MPQNIKIYKFIFKATISNFDLKANISSPLVVTWKRSNQTATTQPVQMVSGKADINQTISLPVNMYFEQDTFKFQQKKSVFSFTMKSPKGQKQAGVVYINLATQVNDKLQVLSDTYTLEKCPVKNSQVKISITAQCIGQKEHDTNSIDSSMLPQSNPSTLSLQSHYTQQKRSKVKQLNKNTSPQTNKQNYNIPVKSSSTSNAQLQQKDKKIKQLQQIISQLRSQNKKLKTDLTQQKQMTKKLSSGSSDGSLINSLKQQLMKGKSIQQKLQSQIDSYRQQNLQHQKQLQTIRSKMDKIYQNLCNQFGIQQL